MFRLITGMAQNKLDCLYFQYFSSVLHLIEAPFLSELCGCSLLVSQRDSSDKSIGLGKHDRNKPETEFTTFNLCITPGEDQDLNQRFGNNLQGSCFQRVTID